MEDACREFDHEALLKAFRKCVPEYISSREVFDYLANPPKLHAQNIVAFDLREKR